MAPSAPAARQVGLLLATALWRAGVCSEQRARDFARVYEREHAKHEARAATRRRRRLRARVRGLFGG